MAQKRPTSGHSWVIFQNNLNFRTTLKFQHHWDPCNNAERYCTTQTTMKTPNTFCDAGNVRIKRHICCTAERHVWQSTQQLFIHVVIGKFTPSVGAVLSTILQQPYNTSQKHPWKNCTQQRHVDNSNEQRIVGYVINNEQSIMGYVINSEQSILGYVIICGWELHINRQITAAL